MTQKNQQRLTARSIWAPTIIAGLVVLIALTFNVLGIHVMSGLSAWQEWRTNSYWHFFAWRVALYLTKNIKITDPCQIRKSLVNAVDLNGRHHTLDQRHHSLTHLTVYVE